MGGQGGMEWGGQRALLGAGVVRTLYLRRPRQSCRAMLWNGHVVPLLTLTLQPPRLPPAGPPPSHIGTNPSLCSQDAHKFRGKAKTKSAKASRVGPKAYSKELKKDKQQAEE